MPDSENQMAVAAQSQSQSNDPSSSSSTMTRPRMLPRYPSHSKRHASFNSPREVPLPSPSLLQSENTNPFNSSPKAQDVSDSHSRNHHRKSSSASSTNSASSPTQSPTPNALWANFLQDHHTSGSSASGASSSNTTRPRSPPSPTHRSRGYAGHDDLSMVNAWRNQQHQHQQQHSQHRHGLGSISATGLGGGGSSNYESLGMGLGSNAAVKSASQAAAPTRSPVPEQSASSISFPAGQQKDAAFPPSPTNTINFNNTTTNTARPFSLPDAQSHSYSGAISSLIPQPEQPTMGTVTASMNMGQTSPVRSTTWIDRCSSSSLPLPSQIPFYALPRAERGRMGDRDRSSDAQNENDSGSGGSSQSSSSRSSMMGSRNGMNSNRSGSGSEMTDSPTSSSPSNTENSFPCHLKASPSLSPPVPQESQEMLGRPPVPSAAQTTRPIPRPVSPFRAPMPPAPRPTTTGSMGMSSSYLAQQPTAMRRFMGALGSSSAGSSTTGSSARYNASAYPPPEPPTILPAPSANVSSGPYGYSQSPYTSSFPSSASSFQSQPPSSPSPYASNPGPYNYASSSQPNPPPAYAYVPFLSHAPPPPDSSIEVETTGDAYKLNVRLPGFKREGITLATKRRRILHVVADRWEDGTSVSGGGNQGNSNAGAPSTGAGHFERRIAFGYDADLVQVRAEFDGVMLKITIPRRGAAGAASGTRV